MKVRIVITTEDGKLFEGEAVLTERGRAKIETKKISLLAEEKPRYRMKSPAWYLWKLKHEAHFFDNNQIRTTKELIQQIKYSFGKKVYPKHAERDFLPLVRDGELKREMLPPAKKAPRGTYIWYSPTISSADLERYKKEWLSG